MTMTKLKIEMPWILEATAKITVPDKAGNSHTHIFDLRVEFPGQCAVDTNSRLAVNAWLNAVRECAKTLSLTQNGVPL
jgi:hypothetical protein